MTKFFKKPLSVLLAALMIVSLFAMVPVTASAAVGDYVAEEDYLTFTAEEANSSVTLKYTGGTLQYKNNNSDWASYTFGTQITLASAGDYVRFRGKNTTFNGANHVSIGGKVACSGNVMSLRLDDYGEVQGLSDRCFYCMFTGCTGLTAAPELPETLLARECYRSMFDGCTSLTTAPELPATTLAQNCYTAMFYGCTSLTAAPELPATSLAPSCYSDMFDVCTSLTTAPELPATSLAPNCYSAMFGGCTSLTTPPELPATELTSYCYRSMFEGCSSIKLSETQTAEYSIPYSVPSGGNGTTASNALTNMFAGTGGTFTGTPEINKTYYLPAPAPSNDLKASELSTGDTIGTDFTSFDPEDYTFVLKSYRFCSGIGYEPDVKSRDFSFTAADDNFTMKVINDTLVAYYDWGDDPDTYRFVDHDGDPTNTAYVLRADHTNKVITLGGYTGEYFLYEPLTENTAKITGYDGVATELTIPSEIDGYTITSIEQLAFAECDGLTSITIPASVTSIGFAAFAACNAMETVIFERPSAQQDLTFGDSAFYGNNAVLSYSGEGEYALFDGDTEITAGAALTTLEGKTLTWKSTSAAPTYDYTTDGNDGYNFNDTLAVGAGDTLAEANGYTSLFNFKILGVQKKTAVDELSSDEQKDVRFVTVVNTDILKDAEEYGYVFAKFDSKADARTHCNEIQAEGSKVLTVKCTGSDNTISGDYGIYNEDTSYKYVTASVNGIGDDTVAARFYIKKGSTYYYADYTNEQNQTYGVCATAFGDLT